MVKDTIIVILSVLRVIAFLSGLILMMCESDDMIQQTRLLMLGMLLVIIAVAPSLIKAAVESWKERDYYLK